MIPRRELSSPPTSRSLPPAPHGLAPARPGSAAGPRVLAAAVVSAAVLVLMLGVLLSGCEKPEDKDKENEPLFTLPRTSPENVLYNLRAIYDGADNFVETQSDTLEWGEKYQELFHPDTFKFYFLPGDEPQEFAEAWWGLAEEVGGFRGLLQHKALGIVDDVKLSWTVNPSEPDIRMDPDNPSELLHPTWRKIGINASILLDVVEGTTTLRVAGASADFYFAPDPADSTLWVITEWYDLAPSPSYGSSSPSLASEDDGGTGVPVVRASPIASLTPESLAGEPAHWGLIKALFS